MQFVNLLVNEELRGAETALTREVEGREIVRLCRRYLALLDDYRSALDQLPELQGASLRPATPLVRELTTQMRGAIRCAIRNTKTEHNRIELLLESLTKISAPDAVATLNHFGYLGFSGWELIVDGVRAATSDGQARLTIDESIAAAGELRCEEYARHKTTFFA